MIQAKIFRAEKKLLRHEDVEGPVTRALEFVNSIGEDRLVAITQAAVSQYGANACVVWYRADSE